MSTGTWLATLLLAASPAAAAKDARCAVTEEMIAGPWTSVKGAFFQDMELAREGGKRVFNSWLHERPEYLGGEWQLENCRLRITYAPANVSFDFASVRVSKNRLYLREEGGKAEAVYKRIKP